MITNYFPRGHDQMYGGISHTKKEKKGEGEREKSPKAQISMSKVKEQSALQRPTEQAGELYSRQNHSPPAVSIPSPANMGILKMPPKQL